MDSKKRKILQRVGAALMLGMSLFNFGAIWAKQKGGTLPRKARNIRKKEQEEINGQEKIIAQVAEEEAEAVIGEISKYQREEQNKQEYGRQKMTFAEKFIRYGAVGVWTVSAGVVFSSVIFNQPFAWGKGMLSFLPGLPHTASITLNVKDNQKFFNIPNEVFVNINLNTRGDMADKARLVFKFDSSKVNFVAFQNKEGYFNKVVEKEISEKEGFITLLLEKTDLIKTSNAGQDKIGRLVFKTKEKGECRVDVDQKQSLILKKTEKEKNKNILGKTEGVKILITKE